MYQSQTLIFGHLSSRQLSKGLWRNAKGETKLWNFVIWSNLSVVSLLAPLLHHLLLLLPHFSNQLTTHHMMMTVIVDDEDGKDDGDGLGEDNDDDGDDLGQDG